jgi:hypothetical protein
MWQLQQTESPDPSTGEAGIRQLSTPYGVKPDSDAPFSESSEAVTPGTR